MRNGEPGEARAIAVSNRVPGSLAQSELKDGGVSPRAISEHSPVPKKRKLEETLPPVNPYTQLLAQALQVNQGLTSPADWLQQLLLNNPTILPMLTGLQQQVPVKQVSL